MKQHLSETFSMNDLAHISMESRTCYIEKFKHLFKMTPFEYIRKLRINHAIELLSATTLSVAEIAQACGFSDSAHLIKIFKEDTGLTPAKYRKTAADSEGATSSSVIKAHDYITKIYDSEKEHL